MINGCFLIRYDANVSTKIRTFLWGDKNSIRLNIFIADILFCPSIPVISLSNFIDTLYAGESPIFSIIIQRMPLSSYSKSKITSGSDPSQPFFSLTLIFLFGILDHHNLSLIVCKNTSIIICLAQMVQLHFHLFPIPHFQF